MPKYWVRIFNILNVLVLTKLIYIVNITSTKMPKELFANYQNEYKVYLGKINIYE